VYFSGHTAVMSRGSGGPECESCDILENGEKLIKFRILLWCRVFNLKRLYYIIFYYTMYNVALYYVMLCYVILLVLFPAVVGCFECLLDFILPFPRTDQKTTF